MQKSINRSRLSINQIKSFHTFSRILALGPDFWLSYYKILFIYYLIYDSSTNYTVKLQYIYNSTERGTFIAKTD